MFWVSSFIRTPNKTIVPVRRAVITASPFAPAVAGVAEVTSTRDSTPNQLLSLPSTCAP
jgi:hypothetical protein